MASRLDVLGILQSGDFGRLIGLEEGPQVDFKEKAYYLDSAKGVRDLVADVAAFANARGGVIVLGVATERNETTHEEAAAEIRGLASGAVDAGRYGDLVTAHVVPLIRDFQTVRYPGTCNGEDVLLVGINVEAQDDHDRPFLVDRLPCAGQDPDTPHAVGWPTRAGEVTHWERSARLQQLIAAGLNRTTTNRWDMLMRPVGTARETLPYVAPSDAQVDAQGDLELVERERDWESWGWYAVQAIPVGGSDIPDFFGDFGRGARGWHGLRAHGFDLALDWGLEPEGARLATVDARRIVILRPSGMVTAAAVASPDFLGWAQHSMGATKDELGELIINPWVLVEFSFEALRCAYELVGTRVEADAWALRAAGGHLKDRVPVRLRRGTGAGPFNRETVPATGNGFEVTTPGTQDAGHDTFELLAKVYGQGFGLGESDVPFAEGRRIDPQRFH